MAKISPLSKTFRHALILACLLEGFALAAPSATLSASGAGASPVPTPAASPAARFERAAVIDYLSDIIGWRRRLGIEARAASDPVEILFVSDDRQMAGEVVALAFQYARAEAALIKSMYGDGVIESDAPAVAAGSPGLHDLIKRREQTLAALTAAKARLADLQTRLDGARRHDRVTLQQKIVSVQGEITLSQSQLDSLDALIAFESGGNPAAAAAAGLNAQIDELERSVPQLASDKSAAAAAAANSNSAAVFGFFGGFGELLRLTHKDQMLEDSLKATQRLAEIVQRQRGPLLAMLQAIVSQAAAAAPQTRSSDIATLNASKRAFEALMTRHKLIADALLPLSKQQVTLGLYAANLERWRGFVANRFKQEVRALILRTAGFAVIFGLIFGAAALWRILTFRYIADLQRRHHLMKARRLVIAFVVIMIVLLDFASELSALTTIMGFAAAGVAVALQNVFVSIAGYFYVSGRYGIRVGDRVQLTGITGDVLEISLFKLTMMELSANSDAQQPTGRIVVFPNSILFQGNGNFFKPIPGANYVWNELRLTLAPDCDWRLAEKRVEEVVGEVFARFRDAILHDYRHVETSLNVRFDTPRPQTRLHLGVSGLEIVLRYPAPLAIATQSSDELSRRLLDALNREPALKLVAISTPALQRAPEPPPPAPAAQEPAHGEAAAPPANGPSAKA